MMASDSAYNQRESDNLMNIVAVVYGVALTTALTRRPDVLLHPLSAANRIPSLALLAAALLTALSFLSYVLAIGGDTPYQIAWTARSSGGFSVIRFLADLVLAGLYVRLLFAATDVATGATRRPALGALMAAFTLVFLGAIVVRLLRRRQLSWLAVGAAAVSGGLWAWTRAHGPARGFDLALEAGLVAGVLVYGWLTHWLGYRAWANHRPAALPPAAESALAADDLTGDPPGVVGS